MSQTKVVIHLLAAILADALVTRRAEELLGWGRVEWAADRDDGASQIDVEIFSQPINHIVFLFLNIFDLDRFRRGNSIAWAALRISVGRLLARLGIFGNLKWVLLGAILIRRRHTIFFVDWGCFDILLTFVLIITLLRRQDSLERCNIKLSFVCFVHFFDSLHIELHLVRRVLSYALLETLVKGLLQALRAHMWTASERRNLIDLLYLLDR